MAGHSTVIKIIEPKVEENAKEKREIEQGEISAIFLRVYAILNDTVYAKYPEWFDQYIGKMSSRRLPANFFRIADWANL